MTRDRIAAIIHAWVRAGDVAQKPALEGLARELAREMEPAPDAVERATAAVQALMFVDSWDEWALEAGRGPHDLARAALAAAQEPPQ
jgi:hypothetical protein